MCHFIIDLTEPCRTKSVSYTSDRSDRKPVRLTPDEFSLLLMHNCKDVKLDTHYTLFYCYIWLIWQVVHIGVYLN